MMIKAVSGDPAGLLASIKRDIAQVVRTWLCDLEGDFSHEPAQFQNRAWLRPHIEAGVLRFSLIGPSGESMTMPLAGIYVGRFIEMLTAHFSNCISRIDALVSA